MTFATPLTAPSQRHFLRFASLFLLAILCVNVAVASGGGGGGAASGATTGKVNYLPLEPAFVVNIQDNQSLRFMQLSLNVMTMDAEVVAAVNKHMAPIRHALLMLFSSRNINEVLTTQARENLRQEALVKVQGVLEHYAHISVGSKVKDAEGKEFPSSVQEVLFTSFVIQ
ncbi:MAG: flagellar basal body-associated FliL family protein [Pseudomonadota bacterium]|nr:flagellar basal body-associated FliL family protein [Pseudomonadota bacterium]